MTSPTEGGSGGASPPAFTRTTITSKSPSEAVFIYSLALLTGRQRNEAGSPKRGEASLSKKDAPLGYDTYPSDSKETVERSGN